VLIFIMRLWIPESPRWLVIHGRSAEGEAIMSAIEISLHQPAAAPGSERLPRIRLATRRFTPLRDVIEALFVAQRRRTAVGLVLMAAQAFFYNAIFFTYALVLTDFYGVSADQVGWYILPFAAGNVLGPILLGRFFDTIGRRPMIAATYAMSGILLTITGFLFANGVLSATGQTIAWMATFFFASAAASSAYLTVSETFPLEVRALAIAFFYAIGTGIGGVAGPWLFGLLIDTGSRLSVLGGYLFGAALMIAAALVAGRWAVAAERKPLESVARPLAARD
jgi:MFS family permease